MKKVQLILLPVSLSCLLLFINITEISSLSLLSMSMSMSMSSTTTRRSRNSKAFQFHIAPMQGYTNASLRRLFTLLSPSSIKWTEMEKVDDIYPNNSNTKIQSERSNTGTDIDPDDDDHKYLLNALEKRLGSPSSSSNDYDDNNIVLQLGTNKPNRLRACVQHTIQHYNNYNTNQKTENQNQKIQEINLNCGCPAIESGGSTTYGASLMNDAALTGQLVASIREGILLGGQGQQQCLDSIRVSVKCRIAVFDQYESSSDIRRPLNETHYTQLKKYISTIYQAGGQHIILHARPAILSGLSPVKNRSVPTLDYDFVKRIASDSDFENTDLQFTVNGGITSFSQLQALLQDHSSTISSFMAGRWCLRRPLDLIYIEELLVEVQQQNTGTTTTTTTTTTNNMDQLVSPVSSSSISSILFIRNAIEQYIDDTVRIGRSCSTSPTIAELCLPLFLIVEQLKDDYNTYYEDDNDDDHHDDDDVVPSMIKKEEVETPLLSSDEIASLYEVVEHGLVQLTEALSVSKKKKRKKQQTYNNNSSSSSSSGSSGNAINFKRLSSSFKSLVGTKVVNKWKRNRNELG